MKHWKSWFILITLESTLFTHQTVAHSSEQCFTALQAVKKQGTFKFHVTNLLLIMLELEQWRSPESVETNTDVWQIFHVWLLPEHILCLSFSFDYCWPLTPSRWTVHIVSGLMGVMCTLWKSTRGHWPYRHDLAPQKHLNIKLLWSRRLTMESVCWYAFGQLYVPEVQVLCCKPD